MSEDLKNAARYTAEILAKIPAFGDSIGDKVTKAQIALALNGLILALEHKS